MARILVVGPHPDDQEIGMGGSIIRLARQGHDVLLVDMTNGEPTPMGDAATRALEARAALDILSPDPAHHPGSRPVRRLCLGLPNRALEHTIEARHALAGVIRAHQAEIMFVPHPQDAHPDHLAATRIAQDARFDARLTKIDMPEPVDAWTSQRFAVGPPVYPRWLFHYYASHLRRVADPSFIFDISDLLALKRAAVEAYRTQFVLPEHNRRVLDGIAASAVYFGSRIGTAAGEPFLAVEPLGLRGLGEIA
jgi:LmbE family N-acetylglucosaminyl deacetylase